jgi:hypothetical protein
MQYEDLSPDQKNALKELDKIIRPLGRTFAKAARDAALIAESHQLNTASVLDDLDAGAEIPNTTGLANATSLSKEELQSLLGDLVLVAASFGGEDKTLVYIKAAGVNAILE